MTKSMVIDRLTQCFHGLEDAAQQRLRTGHSPKTIRRVVCIDHTPLAVWQDNVEYFCVMESQDGVNVSICFKHLFNSDKQLTGMLQRINSNVDKVLAKLQILTTIISSSLTRESVDVNLSNTVINNIPIPEISIMMKALGSRELITDEEHDLLRCLNEAYGELLKFSNGAIALSASSLGELLKIVDDLVKVIGQRFSGPDTLDDLFYFACHAYGEDDEVEDISNISEIFAINLITEHYQRLSLEEKDKFMFLANNELMHLFFSNFSALSRFMDSKHNTFRVLSEYVPIAMKFAGVDSPLFNRHDDGYIFRDLVEKYRYLANAEPCINFCAMDGSIVHTSGFYTSDGDDESLTLMSSVIYGLCCDISSVFSTRHQRVVAPHPDGKSVVYSTDLASCILFRSMINATLQAVYSTGKKYVFDEEDLTSFKLYARLKEMDNSTGELQYCTPFVLIASNSIDKVVESAYVDAMLLRTVIHMNLRNTSDIRVICSDLKDSLEYSSNNLTGIGLVL